MHLQYTCIYPTPCFNEIWGNELKPPTNSERLQANFPHNVYYGFCFNTKAFTTQDADSQSAAQTQKFLIFITLRTPVGNH